MMNDIDFTENLTPVVHTYRRNRRQQARQTRRPSTPYRPPPKSPSSSNTSRPSSNRSPTGAPGTSQNPIDVDDDFNNGTLANRPYVRSESNRPRIKPKCERCGQHGHEKEDCGTPICSLRWCPHCQWKGKAQELCDHVDMSPADFKLSLTTTIMVKMDAINC